MTGPCQLFEGGELALGIAVTDLGVAKCVEVFDCSGLVSLPNVVLVVGDNDGDENKNDRENDQQLDKRKAGLRKSLLSHNHAPFRLG